MTNALPVRPGATALKVGECIVGYRDRPWRAVRLTPTLGKMFRRRSELIRLGLYRARLDPETPPNQAAWARVLADDLIFLGDASNDEFRRITREARVAIDDAVAVSALDDAALRFSRYGPDCQPMSGNRAGRLLDLRCEERLDCKITTMAAVDETAVERQQRVAEARRESDRLRKRLERAAKPKPQKSQTVQVAQPWVALGLSRATWYRQGKPTSACEIRETKSRPLPKIVSSGGDTVLSQATVLTPAHLLETAPSSAHQARLALRRTHGGTLPTVEGEGGIAIVRDEAPLTPTALAEDEQGKFAAARLVWLDMTVGDRRRALKRHETSGKPLEDFLLTEGRRAGWRRYQRPRDAGSDNSEGPDRDWAENPAVVEARQSGASF